MYFYTHDSANVPDANWATYRKKSRFSRRQIFFRLHGMWSSYAASLQADSCIISPHQLSPYPREQEAIGLIFTCILLQQYVTCSGRMHSSAVCCDLQMSHVSDLRGRLLLVCIGNSSSSARSVVARILSLPAAILMVGTTYCPPLKPSQSGAEVNGDLVEQPNGGPRKAAQLF